MWFGSHDNTLQVMLNYPHAFSLTALALTWRLYFPLMLLASGTPALPSGHFLPTFYCAAPLGVRSERRANPVAVVVARTTSRSPVWPEPPNRHRRIVGVSFFFARPTRLPLRRPTR
jgi:hypothetical protein